MFKILDRFGLGAGGAMKKMNIQHLSRRISPTAPLIMSACYSAGLCQVEREMSDTPDLFYIFFLPVKLLDIILIQLTSPLCATRLNLKE